MNCAKEGWPFGFPLYLCVEFVDCEYEMNFDKKILVF